MLFQGNVLGTLGLHEPFNHFIQHIFVKVTLQKQKYNLY